MSKIVLILSFLVSCVFAHPHFFIDSKLDIKDGVIKNEWVFDRLNSRVLLFDFDKNSNKKLDEEEKQQFIKTHFEALKENNYNIFLTTDDEIKIKPENVDVKFENKRIILSFDIKVTLPKVFTMCMMDEKIYFAYKLVKLESKNKLDVQKSEYDYCVGVVE